MISAIGLGMVSLMRVGAVQITPPLILAPMSAVTDLPFRTVCEEHGAGLTITEFLSAHALAGGDQKTHTKMAPSLDGRSFGVQIFGRQEEPMVRAAQLAVEAGAALVDINMGCPARRVTAGECGAALMREPSLAQSLVRAIVAAVPAEVPVTVKHRAGWDGFQRNAVDFACAMVEAGARMITVHGRTRKQGFSGEVDLELIGRVRAAVPAEVPVVGNGDVVDVPSYLRMVETTGCDAVMIGRAAQGNPWLFERLAAVAAGRPDPGPPSLEARGEVFRRHVALILEHKAGPRAIHEVRKACAWYSRGLRGCNALRQRVWQVFRPEDAIQTTEAFFAERRAARDERRDHRDGPVAA